MSKKYYKVPRFIKIQCVDEEDSRIESDWSECDKDGNSLKAKSNKGEKKDVREGNSGKKQERYNS